MQQTAKVHDITNSLIRTSSSNFCFFNVQISGMHGEIPVTPLQRHRETEVAGNRMT